MPLCTLGYETLGIPRVWGNTLGIPLLPAGKPPPSDPYGRWRGTIPDPLGWWNHDKSTGCIDDFWQFFSFFFRKKNESGKSPLATRAEPMKYPCKPMKKHKIHRGFGLFIGIPQVSDFKTKCTVNSQPMLNPCLTRETLVKTRENPYRVFHGFAWVSIG